MRFRIVDVRVRVRFHLPRTPRFIVTRMEDRQSRNKKEIIGDPINRKEDRLVVLSRRQESRAAAAINRRCPLALIEEHGSSSLGSILARRTFAHPRHPEEVLVTGINVSEVFWRV